MIVFIFLILLLFFAFSPASLTRDDWRAEVNSFESDIKQVHKMIRRSTRIYLLEENFYIEMNRIRKKRGSVPDYFYIKEMQKAWAFFLNKKSELNFKPKR